VTGPTADAVRDAAATITRDHMRRSGVPFVKAVPWIRAQCDYEFASVYKEDEAALDEWMAKANKDAAERYGFYAVHKCHVNSRGRIHVAFRDQFIQHQLYRIREKQS